MSRDFVHIIASLLCLILSVVNQTTLAERNEVDHSIEPLDEEHDTVNIEGGKCNISECGRSHEEFRGFKSIIINGEKVEPINKYPWMVSLVEPNSKYKHCAGVILNEYYILTAAHCVTTCLSSKCKNYSPADIQVEFLSSASTAEVEQIISHPAFSVSKRISTNDVALLKIKSPIECDSYKSPICLPTADVLDIQPGVKFTISGWGRTKPIQEGAQDGPLPLKEAVISVVENEMCIGGDIAFEDSNICLVGETETPCKGDSGGPMFYKINGTYYTFGVASSSAFVAKICELNSTVIYVKITNYLDWIAEHIGQIPTKVVTEEFTTSNTTVTEQTT